MTKTSWEVSASAYGKLVGEKGSYYHREVIFPNLLSQMALTEKVTVLELGCGQGVFSRCMPKGVVYFGLDASPTLVEMAKQLDRSGAYFKVQDVTQKFRLTKTNFDHVVIILALQNMKSMATVIANARAHLHRKGRLWVVLNHPAYRIPKQTAWQIQDDKQSRLVDHYMTALKIPIDMTPGAKANKKITWSFHHPISDYFHVFKENGLLVEDMFEWVSPKISVGKNAARENKSRQEIPLFMALVVTPK